MWGRRPCTLFCVSPSEIIHNCDREIPEGDLRQETFRTFSGNKKPALERGAVESFLSVSYTHLTLPTTERV